VVSCSRSLMEVENYFVIGVGMQEFGYLFGLYPVKFFKANIPFAGGEAETLNVYPHLFNCVRNILFAAVECISSKRTTVRIRNSPACHTDSLWRTRH
jgi:hypothetical protein